MKLRNRPLYHCLFCGHVVAEEPGRLAPFCCGQEMTKAAEETLAADEKLVVPSDYVECPPRLNHPWTVKDRETIPA